jgi:hypothetical protein
MIFLPFLIILVPSCSGFLFCSLKNSFSSPNVDLKIVKNMAANLLLTPILLSFTSPSFASSNQNTNIYFGLGCFWHVQHEFVGKIRQIILSIVDVNYHSII